MRHAIHFQINDRGFSLTEVIVATGVLSIVAYIFLQMQSGWQQSMLANRQMTTRDSLKALVDRYIINYDIISKSAIHANYSSLVSNYAGNEALDYCLNGDPSAPTTQCPTGNNCCNAVVGQPFHIIEPSDTTHTIRFSGTDAVTGSSFASTSAAPVRYDINGEHCTTASEDCALELVTTFNAVCSLASANCNGASEIYISYQLRVASGVTPKGGIALKTMKPASPILLTKSASAGHGNVLLTHPGIFRYIYKTYFIIPPHVTSINISAMSAGGGAGGSIGSGYQGSGGGSGGFSSGTFTVQPNDVLEIQIGGGGDGQQCSAGDSNYGNYTETYIMNIRTHTMLIKCTGGKDGNNATDCSTQAQDGKGGAGGVCTGGNPKPGNPGQDQHTVGWSKGGSAPGKSGPGQSGEAGAIGSGGASFRETGLPPESGGGGAWPGGGGSIPAGSHIAEKGYDGFVLIEW